ncbi:unnamed protein product [Notodromas monacha]|uniref:Uncharacterized protein n=1 Tax=Notodromas monacha TaxID=399045 RepID=A0A7R9G8Y8_9CRUS|nr:unnamed protein product [Notodromas monacha]CAG0912274.1 unnamed protein product [Notodromas monacha]
MENSVMNRGLVSRNLDQFSEKEVQSSDVFVQAAEVDPQEALKCQSVQSIKHRGDDLNQDANKINVVDRDVTIALEKNVMKHLTESLDADTGCRGDESSIEKHNQNLQRIVDTLMKREPDMRSLCWRHAAGDGGKGAQDSTGFRVAEKRDVRVMGIACSPQYALCAVEKIGFRAISFDGDSNFEGQNREEPFIHLRSLLPSRKNRNMVHAIPGEPGALQDAFKSSDSVHCNIRGFSYACSNRDCPCQIHESYARVDAIELSVGISDIYDDIATELINRRKVNACSNIRSVILEDNDVPDLNRFCENRGLLDPVPEVCCSDQVVPPSKVKDLESKRSAPLPEEDQVVPDDVD